MRTLIHLSDLHFGTVDPAIIPVLLDFIRVTKPDLVAISGDLTQRARTAEFLKARKFLGAIPFPKIVVPGNHDVPLHNIFERLFRKLDRFRRFISEDLEPFYVDDEIAVAGVNTARALTGKNGRINRQLRKNCAPDLQPCRRHTSKLSSPIIRSICRPASRGDRGVFVPDRAMKILAQVPIDMSLAGHFHVAGTSRTITRYKINSTRRSSSPRATTSTRGRGQPNSLNVIQIERLRVKISQYRWRAERGAFDLFSTEEFVRTANGWTPA
jgi:predicted phosphohydrolase